MSDEVPTAPTVGDVAIWEIVRGAATQTRTCPDSADARRVLSRMSTAAVAERGGVVLATAPRTSRAQVEALRRAIDAHHRGEVATVEAPVAPPAKPADGPKRAPRRDALVDLCDGCDEAAPNHLTVCPRALAAPPPPRAVEPPRAGRWDVPLAVAARTVAEGTTARPPEAPTSRRGQRPAKPTEKAPTKPATSPSAKRKATTPERAALDPADALTVELRKLLDGVVTEARVREIVAEVVPTMVRDALVAALRGVRS